MGDDRCRLDRTAAEGANGGLEELGGRRLLRPAEVARMLGVSRSWLYQAAADGHVPSIRLGGPSGPLRFVPDDLEAWLVAARSAWRPADSGPRTIRRAARSAA